MAARKAAVKGIVIYFAIDELRLLGEGSHGH